MATYNAAAQVESVIEGFESCTTDKENFKHQDHLTVAVCYLQNAKIDEATVKLRTSLQRFLNHHNVDRLKYNETITVFWLELVLHELMKLSPKASVLDKCNSVIESLNNSGLVLEYYSAELLSSPRARESFVAPDLKPLR
jgi:hypothetical protein